jgi:hypothetical protein
VAHTEPLFTVGKKVHLSGILMLLPVGDRKNGTAVEQRTLTVLQLSTRRIFYATEYIVWRIHLPARFYRVPV